MEIPLLFLLGAVICQGIKTVFLRMGILEGDVDAVRLVRSFSQTALVVGVVASIKPTSIGIPYQIGAIYPALNGLLGGIAFIALCKALETVEASTAKPILGVRMVMSVSLGVMVLGESMTVKKGIGILLAAIAVLLLSSED